MSSQVRNQGSLYTMAQRSISDDYTFLRDNIFYLNLQCVTKTPYGNSKRYKNIYMLLREVGKGVKWSLTKSPFKKRSITRNKILIKFSLTCKSDFSKIDK